MERPTENRRSHRRKKLNRKVVVTPVDAGRQHGQLFGFGRGPTPTDGTLVNIGCGGMAAEVSGKVPVGTPVNVFIDDPCGVVQHAHGTVRSVRSQDGKHTLGIAFTEPVLALGDPGYDGWPIVSKDGDPLALVVDDDPGICELLERFLSSYGLRVTTVSSGEDALDLMRQRTPVLMLLDLKLHGMSGVEFLQNMNAEGLHCGQVWAMSGAATDEDARAALSLGACEFMDKPLDFNHLDSCLGLLSPMF